MGAVSRSALDAWVLETAGKAVAYAYSLLRHREQAEDIVQDCYCRLLQKADVYDLPRDGMKLLLTAITNAVINLKTRRKPMLSLGVDSDSKAEIDLTPADPSATAPELVAMGNELGAAIDQGLGLLPVNQRAALELKSLGYSQQEIAEMLAINTSHVGVLIHRARQAMAVYLEPFLGEEKVS